MINSQIQIIKENSNRKARKKVAEFILNKKQDSGLNKDLIPVDTQKLNESLDSV